VRLITIREQSEVLLHSANFIEQLERVKRLSNVTQRVFDLLGDCARSQQSGSGRLRVVVALDDTSAAAALVRELERWLEEVN